MLELGRWGEWDSVRFYGPNRLMVINDQIVLYYTGYTHGHESADYRYGTPAEGCPGEPYYLGFFLMGAYQDIMGDLHNLFGRVNEVHVFLDETEPGGYYIEEVIRGNSIASVLQWIQYSPAHLEKEIKTMIDKKVREGAIKPREGVDLQNFYEHVLQGYTYIDSLKPNLNHKYSQLSEEELRKAEFLQ